MYCDARNYEEPDGWKQPLPKYRNYKTQDVCEYIEGTHTMQKDPPPPKPEKQSDLESQPGAAGAVDATDDSGWEVYDPDSQSWAPGSGFESEYNRLCSQKNDASHRYAKHCSQH